jgi:putative FmdB family regulatory protein
MPTYEYRCLENGHTVEVVQSFSDPPLEVCPVCGGRLRRVFHPVGIVLKGSGFYSTDNRPGKRPAASKQKESEGSSTSESGSKGDSGGSKSSDSGGSKESGGSKDSSGSSESSSSSKKSSSKKSGEKAS